MVFIGGVSYNEIEGIRFINRNLKAIYDKNKDNKNIGRVQLIIVTTEILNKKKFLIV